MKNNNRNVKITIAIISIFFISVSFLAWFTIEKQNINLNETEVLVGISEVTVPILSEENGTYHNVTVEFHLQVDSRDENNLDVNKVGEDIVYIMESLNYDNIASSGNMDYIKNNIITELNNNSDVEILNVYISDINSGSYNIVF